ncbi:general alpha-glucoside permease [Coniochaeta ligniaria NRRL 30616]|uniref:General alpha-glucoside permease n=1 Tax=Coniochaeta ligniaria NRRL 30616 TaxID=1408157 RepID=A0A1J7JJH6_9PEZI|nr:general alpha-glucoside permease [Coniochaeta ligniaria NRRL 30616]
MSSSDADYFSRGHPSIDEATNGPSKKTGKKPSGLQDGTSIHVSIDNNAGGDEQSPLLSPAREEDGFMDGQTVLDDLDEFQTTKSIWYLILLTISIGGLQIAWSVELSNGSPYLLSLGLSKSLMALVWIAGPLSGTLVQPYVGMLSDNCRVRWGKRKPFMLGGAAATICSLLFLAWTKEIVGGLLGLFGADPTSNGVKNTVIVVAVLWVYILDFAINTVQAAIRAFIVDCAPAHQQEAANAMASRIVGVGNIFGYVAGYVDLPSTVWWLGDTQFKDLCAIASIALGSTVLLSCLAIRERDPRVEGPPSRDKPGVLAFFKKIFGSIKRLPPQIKKVCVVQFCAWIGFFPMLFYTSSYIGEIYVEPYLEENPNMTNEELDHLYQEATRIGTFALLIFACTSLATNVFLPFFIAPTYDSQPVTSGDGPAAAQLKDYEEDQKSWLDYLVIPGFTLRRAWMLSQILFFVAMTCTVFVRTVEVATILIGLVGITWALTLWAPWAIISAEISRRDAEIRERKQKHLFASGDLAASPGSSNGYSDQSPGSDSQDLEEEADQAGVILGIHNMAIAAPQIIATVSSSIIFYFFQKPRGTPGDHSIAIVMALGGIAVLVSAYFIHLIKDEAPVTQEDDLAAVEEGESSTRPSTSQSRTRSFEGRPRSSLERATLVRNTSFGGAEY